MNNNTKIVLCLCSLILLASLSFAQVSAERINDSILNASLPKHLQNEDYKTNVYTTYQHCGTDEYQEHHLFLHPELIKEGDLLNEKLRIVFEEYKLKNKVVPKYEKDSVISREEELKKQYYLNKK